MAAVLFSLLLRVFNINSCRLRHQTRSWRRGGRTTVAGLAGEPDGLSWEAIGLWLLKMAWQRLGGPGLQVGVGFRGGGCGPDTSGPSGS